MNTKLLHANNNEQCILFMNGWGCDENLISHLNSNYCDVLVCSDYRDILVPNEIERLFENYSEVHLVAWSFGVYVSNLIYPQYQSLFSQKIAINGTIYPVDNSKGIPPAIFQGTLDHFNESNREKFWLRMCGGKAEYNNFKKNPPLCTIEEQKSELIELQSIIKNHKTNWNLFEQALIGANDLIFVPENQKNAWSKNTQIILKDYPHYCFNRWDSWDEIIQLFRRERS